jgi:Clp amino terminal domain, pathogenicity island component
MTPGPSLQELITTVRSDAPSPDPLDQLATASRTVAELVDVGDAVLGHFVDQCRRSGRSWSEISGALGVTKQAAHKRFSLALAPTLERTTERARSALRAAVEDARSLGHNYVGTEHILLGLYEPARGLAAQILGEAGITRAGVEERILHVAPRGPAIGAESEPPFTPRAAASLAQAVEEALSLGHNYVGTEHLLLALFADPKALAAKLLSDSEANYDDFRNQVIEKLSGYIKPGT